MPHRHEHVARLGLCVFDGNRGRGEELEPFRLAEAFVLRASGLPGEQECEPEHERGCPEPGAVASSEHDAVTMAMPRATSSARSLRGLSIGDCRPRRREAVHPCLPQSRNSHGA